MQIFKKNDFELKFVGRLDDKILQKIESSAQIFRKKNNLTNLGYQTHDIALKHMQDSTVLLMTNFEPSRIFQKDYSRKIFEYLATGKRFFLSVQKMLM